MIRMYGTIYATFSRKKAHFDHLAFFVCLGQVSSKYNSLQALDGLVIN